jgi:peptidoglycan/xylan/chitin deacetylase (PgdA/CDA1 family)
MAVSTILSRFRKDARTMGNFVGSRISPVSVLTSRCSVVLMYHGVQRQADRHGFDESAFDRQLRFLRNNVDVVDFTEWTRTKPKAKRVRVLLTFDDGFRNNAQVAAPILRLHRTPAIFFISLRHLAPGKYLWFSYLRALREHFPDGGFWFRGSWINMSPEARVSSMQHLQRWLLRLRPHPEAMYSAIDDELPRLEEFVAPEPLADRYAGMSPKEIEELSRDPLFEIGAHTSDHPLLTRCDPAEARKQMGDSKLWLQQLTGRLCKRFAYPAGDYNASVLQGCADCGFEAAFSVEKHRIDQRPDLQLPRVGIYRPDLQEFGCKVQWGGLLRTIL